MGWYPCGCCQSCVYFTDTSDRADSTDLGADWTEVAGDWEIDTNLLQVATSSAVITCDELNPAGTAITATATLKGEAEGDQLRILVDYVDADNYWFAEVEWGPASGTGALRIWQRVAGVNTLKGRTIVPEAVVAVVGAKRVTLVVCIGNGLISATTGQNFLATEAVETTSKMGLATGTVAGAVTFNDVSLSKHAEDLATCPACTEIPCTYFSDDYGRSDGTAVGNDWTEVAQNWTLDTGQLKTTAADSLCTCNQEHPEDVLPLTVSVKLKATAQYDRLHVIANYVDTSNYWFMQLQWGAAAGNGTARLFKRVGGANTQIGSDVTVALLEPDSEMSVRLCVTATQIAGEYGSPGLWIPVAVGNVVATSSVTGCGTANLSGTAYFDDFQVTRHYVTDPACNQCGRPCLGCVDNQGPLEFEVTISGIVNGNCAVAPAPEADCSGFNDSFVTRHSMQSAVSGVCEWTYVIGDVVCPSGEWSNSLVMVRIGYHSADPPLHPTALYRLEVICSGNTTTGFGAVIFEIEQAGPFDCLNFNNLNVPFLSDGPCDGSGATCTISTV